MQRRRLGLSIALGTLLTVTLLLGFNLMGNLSLASTETIGTIDELVHTDSISTAHVVVQFADGQTAVRPVTWTGSITRITALADAGFDVIHVGDAICSIEGEGCPEANCFCEANLWAQGQWSGTSWDISAWPPPDLIDGDAVAFRNGTQPDYSDFGLAGLLPGAPTYVSASDALQWMLEHQNSDGSYPSWSYPSGGSVRALVALGSAGYDPGEWGSPSLLDYLTIVSKTETVEFAASSASNAGKLALGAAWTDQDVTDFAGINLPISITAYYSPTTGMYGEGSGDTAWAILGLYAADEHIPTRTIDFLKDVQNPDGGWSWNEWSPTSEVQHTSLCVQALLAGGEPVTSTEVVSALALIDSGKNEDGGYGYHVGNPSDVNTSAYVIQSVLSVDQVPTRNWCSKVGCSYLLSEQAEDGSFGGYSPLVATQEAIPALMHRPYGPWGSWTYHCYVNHLPLVAHDDAGPR